MKKGQDGQRITETGVRPEQEKKDDRTGKPLLMKELNASLLMEALEKQKEATRVELSAMTKISQPTVNMLIGQLVEEGTVVSCGIGQSTGGRRAELFALNRKRAAIAVILVKRSGFEYAVTDLELTEEFRGRISCTPTASYTKQLSETIRSLLDRNPKIQALAVGVPGAVLETGEVFSVPQIPEWEHFMLKEYLEREHGLKVTVMNDINATAIGYLAVTKDIRDMVYLYAEEQGLGAGIVIGGKLHPGFGSFAGEAGFMQVGGKGSLEAQLAVADDAQRSGILTKIVVNIICIVNPERIMLGGSGMSKECAAAIKKGCLAVLPKQAVPEFDVMENVEEYYKKGLCTRGRELLDRRIHIV